jgi:hypothetical protein
MYPVPKKAKEPGSSSILIFFKNWKLSSSFECSWFQKSKPFTIQFIVTKTKTINSNPPNQLPNNIVCFFTFTKTYESLLQHFKVLVYSRQLFIPIQGSNSNNLIDNEGQSISFIT